MCAWGKCRSDSRYSHKPHMKEVKIFPVSEPWMNLDRCRSWLKACTRPNEQMNVDISHIITCAKSLLVLYATCLCPLIHISHSLQSLTENN